MFKRAWQAMIDMDLCSELPSITVPTLVIGGDEGIMTPREQGPSAAGQQYIADHIPGARKHVIRGSNHSTLFDGTEENCRVVHAIFKGEL